MACGVWAALTAALAFRAPGAWAAAAVEAGAPETCSLDSSAAASSTMLQRDQMLSMLTPAKLEKDVLPKDVEDFLLIAGATNDDVNLTASALEELGWKKGVLVADTTHAAQGMLDHARTWSKGDKCLAAFASTNDQRDEQQIIGGLGVAPVSFCGFNMHAGVVDEMAGFMKAPNWAEFLASLHAPACKSVTAVGHSMGGSLATVFAACANKGDPALGFGQRSDYDLVTFSPFAISAGPLYSGQPGQSFSGMRYNIVGSAGGRAGPEAALPADTRPFRVSILQFAIGLTQMLGLAELSQFIRGQMEVIRHWTDQSSWDDAKEAAWRQHWTKTILPKVLPLTLQGFALSADPPAFLTQLVTEAAQGGFLFYAYDMVGAMSQPYGFQHALQDFQPMPHPFKTPKGVVYDKIPASEGAPFPKGDIFQIMLSILANGGHLPNHQPCCYSSSNSDCGAKFTDWSGKLTVDSFACRNSVFR